MNQWTDELRATVQRLTEQGLGGGTFRQSEVEAATAARALDPPPATVSEPSLS